MTEGQDQHGHGAEHVEGEVAFSQGGVEPGGTALVSTPTLTQQQVPYVVIDGDAVAEGDILLGTAEELAQGVTPGDDLQSGVAIEQERYRWTHGIVPYTIASGFSAGDRQEILDAIAHWRAKTRIRFVQRTTQANYVEFRPSTGCSSMVGMRGGRQFINLAPACSLGNVIHEIGHAVGLWHEQSREDRDSFVTIHWANITPNAIGNFQKRTADGVDVGPYDYGSIMHYPRKAFSRNGQDTIVPKRPGVTIGQRQGLSPGDIATVRWMYPNLEPSRSWHGVQFRGSVPANGTRTWFTHSWPSYWYVVWSLMPTSPLEPSQQQLSLEVRVSRQGERLAKYYLVVRNHSNREVSFDARYTVLGWSPASRDEPEGDGAHEGAAATDAGGVDEDLLIDLGAGTANGHATKGATPIHAGEPVGAA